MGGGGGWSEGFGMGLLDDAEMELMAGAGEEEPPETGKAGV
jgi:hypothetical protein